VNSEHSVPIASVPSHVALIFRQTGGLPLVLGRKLLLLAIGSVSLVLLWQVIVEGDLPKAWRNLNVPSGTPAFVDTRTITHSIECKRMGYDPYTSGRCDPMQRLYNYPPIWLELPFGPDATNVIGFFIAASFALVLLALLDLRRGTSASIMVTASLSPPMLFGIAHGNTDILVFSLICVLFYISGTLTHRPPVIAIGSIVLTVLKIYPIAIVATLFRFRPGALLFAMTAALLSLGTVLLFSGEQLTHVFANTPLSTWRSYGAPVIQLRLTHGTVIRYDLYHLYDTVVLPLIPATLLIGLGISTAVLGYRYRALASIVPEIHLD